MGDSRITKASSSFCGVCQHRRDGSDRRAVPAMLLVKLSSVIVERLECESRKALASSTTGKCSRRLEVGINILIN